jgi:serine/threonine-protein kinase
VIRWEKDRGLPVHRVPGGRKNAVFAFTETLDNWLMPDSGAGRSRLLAVLPFVNAAANPDLDGLCEGLTESLISRLAQSAELRVMARSSVARFHGPAVDIREAGRALGVPLVVAGVVRQERDEVIVRAELVNTRTSLQQWGSRYSQPADEIWALEPRIVDAIAKGLSLHLTPNERDRLTRESTRNSQALRLYWRGRQVGQQFTGETLQEAISLYQQAIALDPGYARAYAALAETYAFVALGYSTERPLKELVALGEQAARAALARDASLAEPHCALGMLLAPTYDLRRIEAEFQRAIELQPSYALARTMAAYSRLSQGRREDAIAESNIALELDPVSLHTLTDGAAIHAYAGDLTVARELMDRARALYCPPGAPEAPWLYVYALIDQLEGRFDAAIDLLERCTRTEIMHTIPLAILGYCYARSGQRDRAAAVLDRLAGLSTHRHAIQFSRAAILAGLDDTDGALDALERGYEERNPWLFLLNIAPWFDAVRSHPRYRALVARLML